MKKVIHTHDLSCGSVLLMEPDDAVASTSMRWLLPAGSSHDPDEQVGVSAMLEELIFRGAGDMDSRALSESLDRHGLQRHTDISVHHLEIASTCTGNELPEAIRLIGLIVRNPALPRESMESSRSLCIQALESLKDDPRQEVMIKLKGLHRPSPMNRSGYGERSMLENLRHEEVRDAWRAGCVPGGCIISLAGRLDPKETIEIFEQVLDGWTGHAGSPAPSKAAPGGTHHEMRDSNQVHIGAAWHAPSRSHPDAPVERMAMRILSGTSSGRLFTEVRQKRSLCYSVGARYQPGRDQGTISLYAGTTPERAQETLDVCLQEFERMGAGVTSEEFERARTSLESAIVLGGESTRARSAALAGDYFTIGRTRSMEELLEEVRGITLQRLNEYLESRLLAPPTIVTFGPASLEVPVS